MSNKKVIIILSIFLISFFSTGLRAATGAPLTVTVNQAPGQADPTGSSPINFEVIFSASVNDFAPENVAISGTAGATTATITGSGTTYNVAVSGMTSSGTVIASIDTGKAHDSSGNANEASTSTDNTVTYDNIPLMVTINQASGQVDPTNAGPINFDVVFSKPVSDFATGDVTLGGTAGATTATVTGSGTTYNVAVSGMTGSGTVIATIVAGVAHDAANNVNEASTSTDNTVTYDTTAPTVTITSTATSPTKNSPIPMTATFSKTVIGFSLGGITVGNGAASNLAGSGAVYTFDVTPSGQGTITVDIPAGVAKDAAGNGNTAAAQFSIIYDSLQPTIAISSPSNNAILNISSVAVSGTASDTGSGLQKVEVSVDSGAFAPATVTGTSWSFTISNLSDGPHTITAKATDNAGNINQSTVSVSVDASLPAINITSPADGYIFTDSSVTVTGTASDNIGLSKVEVKVGTGDWQLASGTNSWSATVTLSEGSNTIYARATDTSGNIQQTSITVTVVSAPSIDNVRALIISNSSIKIMWATNQSNLNIVRYGYNPALGDEKWSSWNNNTGNPDITIDGLTGQSVYYQVFSYNASNSSAYSNSSIFKFVYPLQVALYYVEPIIFNNNETWLPATRGHIGKFIGIDGYFNNTGEDQLNLTIYNEDLCPKLCNVTLNKNENISFMNYSSSLGRNDFEIKPDEVKWQDKLHGSFNTTLQIIVSGQNGSLPFSYTNTSSTTLPIIPIFRIKRALDKDGNDVGIEGEGTVLVSEGSTTPVKYVLEANSSINLTNVSIYDPFYPGKYYNISNLQANKPNSTYYTYSATTKDLSSMRCEISKHFGIPCIINQATFEADIEPTNGEPVEHINDTEYLELWVLPYRPSDNGHSGGGGSSGGGGGIAPSEDTNNIERREVREMDVLAKTASTYLFSSSDPVMVIAFESSVSENEVPVSVEILKNRSKNIKEDAPGKLYKYFNVFVGTSGFSQKVSKGVIAYRVNNTWLEENNIDPADISLYKWRGTWVKLDTEIAENRSNYTYYASLTGNFSSFAISAAREQKTGNAYASMPGIPAAPVEQQNTTQAMANFSGGEPKHKIPGLSAAAILVFGIAGIIFRLKRNHKKFNRGVRK